MRDSSGAPSRKILIVEDAATCVETLEAALSRIPGLALVVTNSAEEAIGELAASSFAAIITDINLPGMSGLELISRVRSAATFNLNPIIVISGDPNPDAPAHALVAGANAFFSKPFSPAAVRRTLEELLDEN